MYCRPNGNEWQKCIGFVRGTPPTPVLYLFLLLLVPRAHSANVVKQRYSFHPSTRTHAIVGG